MVPCAQGVEEEEGEEEGEGGLVEGEEGVEVEWEDCLLEGCPHFGRQEETSQVPLILSLTVLLLLPQVHMLPCPPQAVIHMHVAMPTTGCSPQCLLPCLSALKCPYKEVFILLALISRFPNGGSD